MILCAQGALYVPSIVDTHTHWVPGHPPRPTSPGATRLRSQKAASDSTSSSGHTSLVGTTAGLAIHTTASVNPAQNETAVWNLPVLGTRVRAEVTMPYTGS